jgi:hypothetical protein
MKSDVRILNGYRLIFLPEHSRAMKNSNWEGYVYEHIVVAEECVGRNLKDEEVVHHLNGKRDDNRHQNLLVLERSQHAKLHAWIDSGASGLETARKNRMNSMKMSHNEPKFCKICFRTLQDKQSKFCGIDCQSLGTRIVNRPEKNQLKEDIEKMSFVKIGKKYGVSDNTIRKWAKQYGIMPSTLSQAIGTPMEGAETSGEVKSS